MGGDVVMSAARKYPTAKDYRLLFKVADRTVRVSELAGAVYEMDRHSMPKSWGGRYATVFKCRDASGRSWAVRCPGNDTAVVDRHYRRVSEYWRSQPADYAVEVRFHSDAIPFDGRLIAVTTSPWIEGADLKQFVHATIMGGVEVHSRLRALRQAWQHVARDMQRRGIAHGDLHHDNILVECHGGRIRLKLLDYDSLVIPDNEGEPEAIAGVPHYQHPRRQYVVTKSRRVDRFSILVVDLSLLALQEAPNLWHELSAERGEGLLLCDDDLRTPEQSVAMWRLQQMSPPVQQLCRALRDALADADPLACPYPWDVVTEQSHPAPGAASAVLPGWMKPDTATVVGSAVGLPPWLARRGSHPAGPPKTPISMAPAPWAFRPPGASPGAAAPVVPSTTTTEVTSRVGPEALGTTSRTSARGGTTAAGVLLGMVLLAIVLGVLLH